MAIRAYRRFGIASRNRVRRDWRSGRGIGPEPTHCEEMRKNEDSKSRIKGWRLRIRCARGDSPRSGRESFWGGSGRLGSGPVVITWALISPVDQWIRPWITCNVQMTKRNYSNQLIDRSSHYISASFISSYILDSTFMVSFLLSFSILLHRPKDKMVRKPLSSNLHTSGGCFGQLTSAP